MKKDGFILRDRSDGYPCKIRLWSLMTLTLLFIMILSLGREPWRLVEYQCGTNLVPLQGIFKNLHLSIKIHPLDVGEILMGR